MKRAIVFLCVLLLLTLPAYAAALSDSLDTDDLERALPETARGILGKSTVEDADPDAGLNAVFSYLRAQASESLSDALHPVCAALAVVIVCAAAAALPRAGDFDYVTCAGCLAIAAACAGDVRSLLSEGSAALDAISDFSRVLLPTLATAATAAGAVNSAAAKYAAASLFTDLLLTASRKLVVPLLGAFTAAAAADAALGEQRLSGVTDLIQWLCRLLMKGLTAAFVAYLSLTGLVAAEADAAAVKAAKAVLSAALPVVGKTIADASESLVAGAAVLRSAIGVFGLLGVLASAALPALRLGLRYLLFRAAAAVAAPAAGRRIGGLLEKLGSAYGMMLGLVGTASVMEFLAVFSLVRTVTG